MTTGFKILIGVVSVAVVATGGYFIWQAATGGGKEKEVRDAEKEKFASLGSAIEIGRKNHPALSEWYDGLTLNQTALVEEGWAAMSDLQKEKIFKGLKQKELPSDIANFFRTKGANI